MDNNVLKPTLKEEGYHEKKTYDIGKLFYVAFFGGTIPITVLGARNAAWLGISKRYTNLFYFMGILILLAKMIFAALIIGGAITISTRYLRYGVRIADIVLYIIMYFSMKPKFYQHKLSGGQTLPLIKDAIKWVLIGIAIEIGLIGIGGIVGLYVN